MKHTFSSVLGGFGAVAATDLTYTEEAANDKNNSTRIYAHRDGVRVGVVSVSLFDSRKYPYAAAIQFVYVPREHRKTGVAVALLKKARAWARAQKPETRYLLVKALWTGSDKLLHDAYGAHLLSAGEKELRTTPPPGSWDGVPDGPGIEYVWWVKAVDKSFSKGLQSVFGPDILDNPRFGQIIHADFTKATEHKKRGGGLETIRAQF